MDQTPLGQPKSNTGLYVIIAVIVILIIAFVLMRNKTSAPTTSDTAGPTITINGDQTVASAPKTYTVSYTDNGYVPTTLAVHAGDTVSFVNNSTGPMWTASNPHPQHTDLPGFDALKGYAPGTTYSYTFLKIGTWGYHNHVHAFDKGTILVQ